VLWGISWSNLLMLLKTIPIYESDDEDIPKEVDGLDELAAMLGNSG
jgi:hypothetical protein